MSGCYFNKYVILKYIQQVGSLWNAPTLVICKLWATIQAVCELRAVTW